MRIERIEWEDSETGRTMQMVGFVIADNPFHVVVAPQCAHGDGERTLRGETVIAKSAIRVRKELDEAVSLQVREWFGPGKVFSMPCNGSTGTESEAGSGGHAPAGDRVGKDAGDQTEHDEQGSRSGKDANRPRDGAKVSDPDFERFWRAEGVPESGVAELRKYIESRAGIQQSFAHVLALRWPLVSGEPVWMVANGMESSEIGGRTIYRVYGSATLDPQQSLPINRIEPLHIQRRYQIDLRELPELIEVARTDYLNGIPVNTSPSLTVGLFTHGSHNNGTSFNPGLTV